MLAPIITLDICHLQDEDLARQTILDGLQVKRPEHKGKPPFPGAASLPAIRLEQTYTTDIPSIFVPPYPQQLPPIRRHVQVFLVYASENELYARELMTYVSELQRRGAIALWAQWNIQAGQEREKHMLSHLEHADILLLLMSAHFLACSDVSLFEE